MELPEPRSDTAGATVRASSRSSRVRTSLAAALLLAALALCVTGYAAAVHAPGASFSWRRAMLSDLGRHTCRTWYGFWVCSPRARVFNVLVAAAGACLLSGAALVRRSLPTTLFVAVTCLGAGLTWVALFPADGPIGVHMIGAVLALPAPSVALGLHGLEQRARNRRPRTSSWIVVACGALSSLMCLDHLMPAPAPLRRGLAEGVSVAALAVALVVIALGLLRCARD